MSSAQSILKQSIQNFVCQLQQHMIKVSSKMMRLSYQSTLVANHSNLSTKQSSAVALTFPIQHPMHVNSLAICPFPGNQDNSSGYKPIHCFNKTKYCTEMYCICGLNTSQ